MAVIAASVSLLTAACGSTQEAITSAPQETSVMAPSEQAPTTEAPPVETPAETTPESHAYAFGETVSFDDGMHVTIDQPKAFKPSEYAAGTEGYTHFVKFRVTIDNRSGKTFDPTMAMTSVMSGDTQGSEVYDSDRNLGGGPTTKLLNGRKVTYTVGFGVEDPKDIVVQFDLSFDHETAMYSLTGR
jgi:hypothetical protein